MIKGIRGRAQNGYRTLLIASLGSEAAGLRARLDGFQDYVDDMNFGRRLKPQLAFTKKGNLYVSLPRLASRASDLLAVKKKFVKWQRDVAELDAESAVQPPDHASVRNALVQSVSGMAGRTFHEKIEAMAKEMAGQLCAGVVRVFLDDTTA